MYKILLILILITVPAFAAYKISCPSENINAINMTNGNVSYFNSLFNATDCTVNEVTDSSVYQPLTPQQALAQQAQQQTQAQLQQLIQQDEENLAIQDLQNQGLITIDQATTATTGLTTLTAAQNTSQSSKISGTLINQQ